MDSFRSAVFTLFNGDSTLTAMLATTTSIYHKRAPLDAGFPLIIYSKQSGVPLWAFAGPPFDNQVWLFKGIDRSPSAATAEEISKRISTLLTDPILTLSDGTLMYCRRESDIDYEEGTDPDKQIHHVGGMYRTFIDRA
jgi:hypothetical protein